MQALKNKWACKHLKKLAPVKMPNKQQENTNKPMSCVATVKLTNMQKKTKQKKPPETLS